MFHALLVMHNHYCHKKIIIIITDWFFDDDGEADHAVMRATEPTNSIDESNGDRLQSATKWASDWFFDDDGEADHDSDEKPSGPVSDAREEEKIEKPSGEITW